MSIPNPDFKLEPLRARPWQLLPLLPLGALLGGLLGAALGAFNGWLTFIGSRPALGTAASARAMGFTLGEQREMQQTLMDLEATLRMNMVKQSITLGWRAGLVVSLLLVIGIAVISKLRCPLRMAVGVQFRVVKFALLFWFVGGINALILASVAPDWFDQIINPVSGIMARFRSAATVTPSFLREAWVWGSVWGFRVGLVLATIGCLISFATKWRKVEGEAGL